MMLNICFVELSRPQQRAIHAMTATVIFWRLSIRIVQSYETFTKNG